MEFQNFICVCVCVLVHTLLLSCVQLFETPCLPVSFCRWDFPGESTGVDCHFLLQGFFPTHGSILHLFYLLNCHAGSLPPAVTIQNSL